MHAPSNAGTSATLAPLFVDARSRRIISQLERVAPSEASILIVGETATGKEVIAQQIHRRSGRSGPFVAVNCGALSETLGEAALFGHEAGAYTGASGARVGWFEAANGGTLFLDEIGDLPVTLQVALLRVLQERQVVRLGSRKSQPIDVRVIAATNIDVGQAVKSGKFRLDLYFRLSVVTLELPALRERTADILPLAEHFVRVYGEKLQRPLPTLDRDAKRFLAIHGPATYASSKTSCMAQCWSRARRSSAAKSAARALGVDSWDPRRPPRRSRNPVVPFGPTRS
jgi:sigma-54-specific transcriptional regulator